MTDQSPITNQQSPDDDEISFLDLAITLAKHKKVILGLPFVVAAIAAGISLLLPNIYTATTKLFPPQQSQSASPALLAQLSGLAGLVGLGEGGGASNQAYIAMLSSRTMNDKLIQRFGLIPEVARIAAGKDGLITIEVDGRDPKRAADIANAYVEELEKFNNKLAVTDSSRRRLFFERQLAQAKDKLAKTEASARQALERGGLANVEEQSRSALAAIGGLRGQITVKEVQIGAMRVFATDRNPALQRAQQEVDAVKRELAKAEGVEGARHAANGGSAKGAENMALLRDIKANETVVELLTKQYQLAKMDEAKDASLIQVLDEAIEPKSPSKPKRSLIVLVSALVALVAGILWAFVFEAMAKARSDPQQAARLQEIKRFLTRR